MKSIHKITRRGFIRAAAAGAAFTYVRPEKIHGGSANSCLSLGMIGCGGRGTTVADAFVDSTNTGEEVTWDQMIASNQSYEGMIDLNRL